MHAFGVCYQRYQKKAQRYPHLSLSMTQTYSEM